MQSLAREVEGVSMQEKGWLKIAACSHPSLKEYEREAVALLSEHSKIRTMAKSPCLVLYNKRYVFNKAQLQLRCDAVPPESDLICLGVFTRQKETLECNDQYLMSRAQWQKATFIKSSQTKAINLNTLHKISLVEHDETDMVIEIPSSPLPITISSSSDEEEEVEDIYAQLGPFSLTHQLSVEDKEAQPGYLRSYIQLLLDLVVWRRYFSGNDALLKKACRYYTQQIGTHHSSLTLLFLSQMVEHNGYTMSESLHGDGKDHKPGEWFVELATTRLYQEWLQLEMLLFKEARWCRQELAQLREHVAFIRQALPRSLWPNWMSYTMNLDQEEAECLPIYWSELVDGNYEIRGEWLLSVEFEALLLTLPLRRGHSCLTPQLFQTVFMPAVYRCMLDDVRLYLFYVYHGGGEQRERLLRLRNAYQYTREDIKTINQAIEKYSIYSKATTLFDLCAEIGDISSPVVRKLVKKRPEFIVSPIQDASVSVRWQDRHIERTGMPDIEDLGGKGIVPPCMRRVFMETPHLGNLDRMNVTRYLIDMAYTKSEVVAYLSQGHENETDYIKQLNMNYKSGVEAKRINKRQIQIQHHSLYCSAIMNLPPQPKEKSFMRCLFAEQAEEKAESDRRHDYNDTEKECFMRECGATLSRPLVYGTKHPVQYSLQQLSM